MTSFAIQLLNKPWLPWRVRNQLEIWLETGVRDRNPTLYRWLHFGQLKNPLCPVTLGPYHHFFGYYDKSPWNGAGNRLLAHESPFNDRPPDAEDRARVGVTHLDNGNRFEVVGETLAWNWQQGAMLQWHPGEPNQTILYNDRREGRLVGVVKDIESREAALYDRPFYAVTPDGLRALSLNFARLHTHRPGYGYAGVSDPWAEERHPKDDGLYVMEMASGRSELVVSLEQLACTDPKESMQDAFHWLNHIQVSPDGQRLAFFHIWRTGDTGWAVRLYACDLTDFGLIRVLDTEEISHYDWMDNEHILVWARRPDGNGKAFLLCNVLDGTFKVIGAETLTEDGHCSFSPDRRWVLNDTYPDRYDMRTLMLFRPSDGRRLDLARLYSPKARWWGEIRCDLHPRWSRDGRRVCIDSVHDGTRQMYVVDVAGVVS